jgi:hypothetical protein
MASQERLSVDAAAQRLGITPDAVRSRIKRGTLWAIRRNGRVQVVVRDTLTQEGATQVGAGAGVAGHQATIHNTGHGASGTGPARDEAAIRLRAEIAHQKHKVRDLERERERLDRELARQRRFMDMELALRARLQDQLDRLNRNLSNVVPELLDDPTERADQLWKRLGRHVGRLEAGPDKRGE